MPRKLVELSDFYPYHIYARANNKEWFTLPLSAVYNIYANIMEKTVKKYEIRCHSFVLMSNHFHCLLSTPNSNLSESMCFFMGETSRAIARSTQRINRIYGARYKWTIIRSSEHYAHAYKYVYYNPLKANVVNKAEDYPWSTLNSSHQKFTALVKNNEHGFDEHIPQNFGDLISWINQQESDLYIESVGQALKRHEFGFAINPMSGKFPNHDAALHPK